MTLHFKWLSDTVAAAGQITPGDLPAIAAHGFKTIINNRPDGEGGPAQPAGEQIRRAAEALGLRYIYLPVISGHLTPKDAVDMAECLESAATPVFAFCRSGARTEHLYRLATRTH
ncbi:MAG TPA: TIGR01244 family sulfur transferase [Burkholderiaceae bacterium]|nr:TIGR01244 family sulfur transferase [Burkholderiaceae bacterium]